MVGRFNHSHTVGDIIRYINAYVYSLCPRMSIAFNILWYSSQPGAASRPYVLQTTFPSKDLQDEQQSVKEAGLLNSVVTIRYI